MMDEATWLASADPAAMLDGLCGTGTPLWHSVAAVTPGGIPQGLPASDRKLRLWACACCRQVWDGQRCPTCVKPGKVLRQLSPFDAFDRSTFWVEEDCERCHGTGRVGGLTDPCSRRAVEVAERFADGEATADELAKARSAIPYSADSSAWYAAAIHHTPDCVSCFAREGVPPATQAALLREVFGSPWRSAKHPVHAPRAFTGDETIGDLRFEDDWLRWQGGTVPRIARQIYEERAWERMPILGDCLIDSGCNDQAIIDHCHQPGVHVRGCWVCDLLLGKA